MPNALIYGLTNLELLGKTVFDLEKKLPYHLPKGFAKSIEDLDKMVIKTGYPVTIRNKMFLNNQDFVAIYTITKIPLFDDKDNKVKAILTISFESTNTENTECLCKLYRKLHKNPVKANEKFLEYIGFKKYIEKSLTNREIDCLLALTNSRSLKTAAAILGISVKTLETYLNRIKSKTKFTSISKLIETFIQIHNKKI